MEIKKEDEVNLEILDANGKHVTCHTEFELQRHSDEPVWDLITSLLPRGRYTFKFFDSLEKYEVDVIL